MQSTVEDRETIDKVKRLFQSSRPQLYINKRMAIITLVTIGIAIAGLSYSVYELNQLVTELQQSISAK